jgi:hypothetical protein
MMTKKDYIEVADILVSLISSGIINKQDTAVWVVNTFTARLAAKNPKFNKETFHNYISERI